MGRNQEKLAINKQNISKKCLEIIFRVCRGLAFNTKEKFPTKMLPLEKTKVFSFIKSDKLHVKSQSYA